MDRDIYLKWADKDLRMPIGTRLVLNQHKDPTEILNDGRRLGRVVEEAARRFHTPLALPLMDLTLEKAALLTNCGIGGAEAESFHFKELPPRNMIVPLTARMNATCEGVHYIAHETRLVSVGMSIGPFSLASKLVADPISAVFLYGAGATASDEREVQVLEGLLGMATDIFLNYVREQAKAGAKAMIICEPAANQAFFPQTSWQRVTMRSIDSSWRLIDGSKSCCIPAASI